VTIALVVANCARAIGDPDLWWHLRLGDDLIAQRSLAAPTNWSSFATKEWVPTEALPEVVGAAFNRWFGLSGVAWLLALALCLILLSVYFAARFRGPPAIAALGTIVALVGIGGSLSPRPQLLSFALLPIVITAWLASEEDLRPRWWLVPMTWLWSMLHGFWSLGVGYGLMAAVVICLERRPGARPALRLVAVPIACAASVLLTPQGLDLLQAPFHSQRAGFAANNETPWVLEWGRTTPHNHYAQATVLVIAVTVVAWLVTRHRPSLLRVVLLASAAFWVWFAYRTVAIGCLVAVLLMVEAVSPATDRRPAPRRAEVSVLLGVVALCLAVLATVVARAPVEAKGIPTALDPALDRIPPGTTVLNSYGLGGWLAWRHPDLNRTIDGSATPYPAGYQAAYHAAISGEPGWQAFVKRTDAHFAYLDDTSALIPRLKAMGWTTVSRGDGVQVLRAPGSAGGAG
jgi:hypothetical protein